MVLPVVFERKLDGVRYGQAVKSQVFIVKFSVALDLPTCTLKLRPSLGFMLGMKESAFPFSRIRASTITVGVPFFMTVLIFGQFGFVSEPLALH